jgi:hypothetical protein
LNLIEVILAQGSTFKGLPAFSSRTGMAARTLADLPSA